MAVYEDDDESIKYFENFLGAGYMSADVVLEHFLDGEYMSAMGKAYAVDDIKMMIRSEKPLDIEKLEELIDKIDGDLIL